MCNEGRLDEDCSTPGDRLLKGSTRIVQLDSGKWVYVYYMSTTTKDNDSNLSIVIKKSSESLVSLYLLVEGTRDSYLPNILDHNQVQYLVQTEQKLALSKEALYFTNGEPRKMIFGLYTDQPGKIRLEMSVGDYSTSSSEMDSNLIIVYFLLGVAGVLFIIWIVLTVIRIKYQRQEQQHANAPGGVPGTHRRRKKKSEKQLLTIEIIDKYMPARNCAEFSEDKA